MNEDLGNFVEKCVIWEFPHADIIKLALLWSWPILEFPIALTLNKYKAAMFKVISNKRKAMMNQWMVESAWFGKALQKEIKFALPTFLNDLLEIA